MSVSPGAREVVRDARPDDAAAHDHHARTRGRFDERVQEDTASRSPLARCSGIVRHVPEGYPARASTTAPEPGELEVLEVAVVGDGQRRELRDHDIGGLVDRDVLTVDADRRVERRVRIEDPPLVPVVARSGSRGSGARGRPRRPRRRRARPRSCRPPTPRARPGAPSGPVPRRAHTWPKRARSRSDALMPPAAIALPLRSTAMHASSSAPIGRPELPCDQFGEPVAARRAPRPSRAWT